MTVTLYSAPVSPYGNIAEVALRMLGIEYKYVPTSPHGKEPDFQRASPLGRLPAVDDNGFTISDSDAVATYFDWKVNNNGPQSLYGGDPETRSKVIFISKYAQTDGRIISVGVMGLMLRGITDKPTVDKAIAKAQAVLKVLDRLVQDNGHFVGSTYTMADIAVFCQVLSFITGGGSIDAYPRLSAFYNKARETSVFKETHDRSLASMKKITAAMARKKNRL
ncbi:Glutathione S-transferase U2 [Wickerhamiella sorbophila]|uniref:Glutathione S-transferase U2 n=1 Tax=Wickerhamiella sorbophila TaxID=45607 RepID=A0A2T0FML7_9ASCO|nr:Glutathione S-transferase U2 [Wickerhamiella sorbophila]PRT56231.1 Glutathione S-transferase U2 [Wickerhamiella sorbophila]